MKNKIIVGPCNFFQPKDIVNQQFSIPSNILYYVKKNPPTPKIYVTLLRSCKFFYSEKDLLVPFWDTHKFFLLAWFGYPFKTTMKNIDYVVRFEPEKIPFKLWLTAYFTVVTYEKNFASMILKKVVKCNIKILGLQSQKITFDEFQFLTSSKIEELDLRDTVITDNEEKNVAIDCIFACCPNIEGFYYERQKNLPDVFTAKAIQNLTKFAYLSKTLKSFGLATVPRDFDVESVLNLLNARPEIEYHLDFRGPLPKAKTKIIKACVKEILANGMPETCPPVIFYSSQNPKQRKAVCDLVKKTIVEKNLKQYFYLLNSTDDLLSFLFLLFLGF